MGKLLIGQDVPGRIERSCDVCIVGSGPGGSVLAAGLVARGLRVVMLEEGGYFTRDDFTLHEGDAFDRLYQDRGGRTTADFGVTILQGRSVGGGSTVNWTTCFRTPVRVLDHWARHHGVEDLTLDDLTPHFEAVEKRLGVSTWPLHRANRNNRVLIDGCQKMGWHVAPLNRNVRGCADTGYCGMGCPIGAKQGMHRTYLEDALEAGLELFADARAVRIETRQGRVDSVVAEVLDRVTGRPTGGMITVRPKSLVLSGGAINSPALLLRSAINPNGRVGRRTMLHPVVAMPAFYDHPIEGFYGAPQSASCHEFIDRGAERTGFFLECAPVHPVLASLAMGGFGANEYTLMRKLDHMAVILALCVDGFHADEADGDGTVSLRDDGRIRVDYPTGDRLKEAFHAAHVAMARIHLAAGARRVFSLHQNPIALVTVGDLPKLDAVSYGSLEHGIFSAHQMGGCAMGGDARNSVVRGDLRHHHVPNLFIVDGSVFPTALGVNPSETIYALGRRARETIFQSL